MRIEFSNGSVIKTRDDELREEDRIKSWEGEYLRWDNERIGREVIRQANDDADMHAYGVRIRNWMRKK